MQAPESGQKSAFGTPINALCPSQRETALARRVTAPPWAEVGDAEVPEIIGGQTRQHPSPIVLLRPRPWSQIAISTPACPERLQTYLRRVIMLWLTAEPEVAVKIQGGKDGSCERDKNHCRLVRGI
jgi:hypothetical protein